MEEFDVLLTDISRVNTEITMIKTMKVDAKNGQKTIFSLNIDNQSEKNPEMNTKYCLK